MPLDFEKIEESYIPPAKSVLAFVSSMGIGRIVSGATEQFAPQTNVAGRIVVYIAQVGITSTIAAAVEKNTNSTIDNVMTTIKDVYGIPENED